MGDPMKSMIRKFVSPLLDLFESGEGHYPYRKSYRLILKVVGGLFLFLACVSALIGLAASVPGAIIPVTVFSLVAVTSLVVGMMGSDQAVARIWGNRREKQDRQ